MKNIYHDFEVNSNIDKVWRFYTDIKHLEVVVQKIKTEYNTKYGQNIKKRNNCMFFWQNGHKCKMVL